LNGLAIPYELLLSTGGLILAFFLGRRWGTHSRDAVVRQQQLAIARSERNEEALQRVVDDLSQRTAQAEAAEAKLKRSMADIPEIAQRLSATRTLREIPECVLHLVDEVFEPSYALFFRRIREGFVVVAQIGESEFDIGHRLEAEEGLVQWSALKQLPIRTEDLEFESGLARGRFLAQGVPNGGFSLCVPIVDQERTNAVLLIGPCGRSVPHAMEIARTIALMTSVVTASAIVLKQQESLAKTDGLTGLFNRNYVLSQIQETIVAGDGPLRNISVFLFDIDHFKHFNDTNGHIMGDELLKSLSQLLTSHLREGELVGRYGGEEFLMVMPGVAKKEALQAAERIRRMIANHAFPRGEAQPLGLVSISGGVATWPIDGVDLRSFLTCADEALYEAKRQGRNQVVAYASPELVREGTAQLISDSAPPLEGAGRQAEEEKAEDGLVVLSEPWDAATEMEGEPGGSDDESP